MRNKVGFHTGPGGNRTGIKDDYMKKLDSAGIHAVMKSVDDYGPIYEMVEIMNQSGKIHTCVFRLSSGGYDLPDYNLPPPQSANEHWQRIKDKLPPEFDKRVWLEVINEPDKNRSEWLADFSLSIGTLMVNEGYKPALLSWSSGEPEPEMWLMPAMSNLLDWMTSVENIGKVAMALHEYDYGQIGMMNTYPHHIGRFTKLFEACESLGLPAPPVIISEWGWSYNDIPSEAQAMKDIDEAGRLYESYPSIKGAGLWYLGGGFGDIHNQTQKLIKPVGEWCVEYHEPIDPPPDGDEWETVIDEWFEGYNDPKGSDWYDQNGVQQVRNGWELEYTEGENLQVPPEQRQDNPYGLMEAIFRWDAFVPPDERETLLNEKGHAYKMFAANQAWKSTTKTPSLAPGTYRLTLEYYDDCYTDVVNGGKVPPPDPLSFEAKIGMGDPKGDNSTYWVLSQFLQDNMVQDIFTITEESKAFFRFRGRWAIKNVSSWVKHFMVERLVDSPPIPPEPEPDDGCARTPYKRVYHVLPQDSTYDEFTEVSQQSYVTKATVGFSYDDAGVGCGLESKKAVLYNIPEGRHQEFADWYVENYPGTAVEFAYTEGQAPIDPPPTGNVGFGVHASATGSLAFGELDLITSISPDTIKVLSSISPDDMRNLSTRNPNSTIIIRAFLAFGDRVVSPQQFYDWTISDVLRTVDAVVGNGDVWIEIHNEPNLAPEGLNTSWFNGHDFANWWLEVLTLYKKELGDYVKYLYPGLSPGHGISEFRRDSDVFFMESMSAWQASDIIGVHAYWNTDSSIMNAIDIVKGYTRMATGKLFCVTEASNTSYISGTQKGHEYVTFWNELKRVSGVVGLTYFVVSAAPETFDSETWIENGQSNGIAEVVAGR